MKKRVISFIFTTICISGLLCGCNQTVFDTNLTFNYAQISMPDGSVVEGKVDSWTDYDDGDQVQVKIDGVVYLTDTTRCVLMKK